LADEQVSKFAGQAMILPLTKEYPISAIG